MYPNEFININTFLLIGTLFVGVIYLFVFFKRGASQASVESNEILRGLIEDQKAEIKTLRERSHAQGNQIQLLMLKIEKFEYLEKVVNLALLEHFSNQPEVVEAVKKVLMGSEKKEGGVI
jgi:hypothetical protein